MNDPEHIQKISELDKIKNPWIALVFIGLSMIFTVKHSVNLYFLSLDISPTAFEFTFTLVAIAVLDSAIIILAAHGQKRASQFFALAVFAINLLYFWHGKELEWAKYMELGPGLIWSLCFAYILYYYGELFVSLNETEDKLNKKSQRISDLEHELGEKTRESDKLKESSDKDRIELESLRIKEKEFRISAGEMRELSGKYSESLKLLSEKIGGKDRKLDSLRRAKDYWARKVRISENGNKYYAQVKFDLFNMMYNKIKDGQNTKA